MNVAVVAPAATVTDDGTVSSELLSDTVTAVPPEGAAPEIVTVHVLFPAEVRLVGAQLNELRLGDVSPGPVIVPPVAVVIVALPEAVEATTEPTAIGALSEEVATVTLTTPTTPLEIVWFPPYRTHVCLPEVVEHWMVLPAFAAAVPAVEEIETTFPAGYVSAHCRAEGW